MEQTVFLASAACYLFGGIFYLVILRFLKDRKDLPGLVLLILGFSLHIAGLVMRAISAGHAPLSNTYESMVFFSWCIVLFCFYIRWKFDLKVLVGASAFLAFVSIGAASVLPESLRAVKPLVPALQSYWLVIHVITSFLGYAGFAVAFVSSISYLVRSTVIKDPADRRLASADELCYSMITIGFAFLTLGILTGAVWAKSAWGEYWSWDKKEIWALVTWLIYVLYLHLRLMFKWKGKPLHWISILGFLAVLFTYFGVNYLLDSLHSYR